VRKAGDDDDVLPFLLRVAHSGQESWVRFLSSMGPHRRTFSRSALAAYCLMTPLVLLVASAG
jgi:hypothetical protein